MPGRLQKNSSVAKRKDPIFGPSLLIEQQAARWTGDDVSLKDKVCKIIRIITQKMFYFSVITIAVIAGVGIVSP